MAEADREAHLTRPPAPQGPAWGYCLDVSGVDYIPGDQEEWDALPGFIRYALRVYAYATLNYPPEEQQQLFEVGVGLWPTRCGSEYHLWSGWSWLFECQDWGALAELDGSCCFASDYVRRCAPASESYRKLWQYMTQHRPQLCEEWPGSFWHCSEPLGTSS